MTQEPREFDRVELVWPGKRTKVERVRLPFQTIEHVNDVRASAASGAQGGLLTSESQLPSWWPEGWQNKLIWGDNKYVLASLVDEFAGKVDLIYIDPPFATGSDFSFAVDIGDVSVTKEQSVIEEIAYRDTWGKGLSSYLEMLYERLVIASELLSPRGSMYVHIGPGIGAWVRLLLDEILPGGQKADITWKRVTAHSDSKRWGVVHDQILWSTKSSKFIWNPQFEPHSDDYVTSKYTHLTESGRRYRLDNLTSPNPRPNLTYVWRGHQPPRNGWRYKLATMEQLFAEGRIQLPAKEGGRPQLRRFLDEMRGQPLGTVWTDLAPVNSQAAEDTGYDTQKPEALLTRIINSSTDEGSLVLDFFSGSGTTPAVAEKLGRRWLAVDLGRFAIQTTRKRLLEVAGCRPFEVLNLGRYERRYWQGVNAGETVWEYYRFILDLYQAQAISGFTQLHGQKASRFVHVGATDAPVTFDEVARTLEECAANGLKAVDVLGWEWEMGINPAGKDDLARTHGVDVRLIHIPREVMDKRAVDAGDVHFFELSVAAVRAEVSGVEAVIVLDDFLPAIDEYMRQKVAEKAAMWSDWIDYWSVDFEHDGETYINQWQSYRTRKDPKLALRSAPHVYASPGTYRVVVKVIDIFGNDTTQHLDVSVK